MGRDSIKQTVEDFFGEHEEKELIVTVYLQNVVDQNKNLFTFKEQISIDYEYETLVNIDDLVYSYQVPKACKHLCIHYNAPSDYKIIMEGFGFMSTGNSQRQRLVKTENGCMIRFLDWILPGNGVMIVLQHK